jgi:creatinine amidohydrolase
VPFGCNDYFGASVGSMTLSSSTFRLVLQDMLASLIRHGFRRLIFINGHGGNWAPVHEVCRDINIQQGILILSLYIWRVAGSMLPAVIGEALTRVSGGHGANPLASVAMHLFPDFVRPDLTPAPYERQTAIGLPIHKLGSVRFGDADIDLPLESKAATPTGVVGGDARLCSAQTRQALIERIVGLGARFIAHFAKTR